MTLSKLIAIAAVAGLSVGVVGCKHDDHHDMHNDKHMAKEAMTKKLSKSEATMMAQDWKTEGMKLQNQANMMNTGDMYMGWSKQQTMDKGDWMVKHGTALEKQAMMAKEGDMIEAPMMPKANDPSSMKPAANKMH